MGHWNSETILMSDPDLIQSDTSTKSWEVTCQGSDTGGTLISTRKDVAHKLLGAISSHASTESICEGQKEIICTVEDGQHISSGLHQQSEREHNQEPCLLDSGLIDVVPGKEYTHPSPAPSRDTEFTANRKSWSMRNHSDWKLNPQTFEKNQQMLWTTGSGSICV